MASERFEELKAQRKEWLYERVTQLQEFLAGSDPILLMAIDGVQTQFDRAGARKELKECMGELARLEGGRPGMTTLDIG